MQLEYSDFFEKPNNLSCFIRGIYGADIHQIKSGSSYSEQFKELFRVCFSHHVEPSIYLDKTSASTLKYRVQKGGDNFFEDDNLSAYFLEKYYTPPSLYNGIIDRITKKKLLANIENDANYDYKDLLEGGRIVDYELFKRDVTLRAFDDAKHAGIGSLGSNSYRFLIGEIGEGKTALLTKLYRDMLMDPDEFSHKKDNGDTVKAIPIYYEIDFPSKEAPKPLKKYFFYELYEEVYDTIEELSDKGFIDVLDDLEEYNYENKDGIYKKQKIAIKHLISLIGYLAGNNIRLLFMIDNIDSFHYYYARYAFFEDGLEQLNDSIKSLEKMIEKFMPSSKERTGLKNAGISVIFSLRSYVYEYIKKRNPLFNTKDKKEASIYTILPVNDREVILTRAKLFSDALMILSKKGLIEDWHQKMYFSQVDSMISKSKSNYFKRISDLSHHGNRSLIDFIVQSLSIDIRDKVLSERLLIEPKSIVLDLYLLNGKQKYSQGEEFFPNLFLNDCLVYQPQDSPKDAHKPHRHTYFLKYFILKYIVNRQGVTYNKLISSFSKYYDEHLVKHVVGSLCTANEFQCAEIPLARTMTAVKQDKIVATKRGESLLSKHSKFYPDLEFCFDFQYLQHVVDDYWLSFPKEMIGDIYNCGVNYKKIYYDHQYTDESIERIKIKNASIQHFLALLESSLEWEINYIDGLKDFLISENLILDDGSLIDTAIQANLDSVRNILNELKFKGNYNPRDAYSKVNRRKYTQFFEKYREAGCPNVTTL